MKDFRTLRVWQKAHELTLRVYRHSSTFSGEELCQIGRHAASVAANLAEGCSKRGNAEFRRFSEHRDRLRQ